MRNNKFDVHLCNFTLQFSLAHGNDIVNRSVLVAVVYYNKFQFYTFTKCCSCGAIDISPVVLSSCLKCRASETSKFYLLIFAAAPIKCMQIYSCVYSVSFCFFVPFQFLVACCIVDRFVGFSIFDTVFQRYSVLEMFIFPFKSHYHL